MTTDTNCGQVRGPVQFSFSRSVEPIEHKEITITRMAVTKKDEEKEKTMGRKHIIPYGLYRMHGYVSAPYAARTGFSEDDLELLWQAFENMFDHDRSSARAEMDVRKLIVFKHQSALGNARASKLFDAVTVTRKNGGAAPARKYEDYTVAIDRDAVPENVEVIERM